MNESEAIPRYKHTADKGPQHYIAIIGAGLGGLSMALELRRLGIDDFVIYDRQSDVGGTWRSNVYPGISLDSPAQIYQFRDHLNPSWSRLYPGGAEVLKYIERLFQENDLLRHLRPNTDVRSRTWDEKQKLWRLRVNDQHATARFVISAIGPFPEPRLPQFQGIENFQGTILQSSSWDGSVNLTGKRVAVIGTGASAVQIIPEIAKIVGYLGVYQRTPIWVIPKWNPSISPWLNTLFRRVPKIHRLVLDSIESIFCLAIVWILNYGRIPLIGSLIQLYLNHYYFRKIPSEPIRAKLLPDYPFACKPFSMTSNYLESYSQDNVELITDRIHSITPNGISTVDGLERLYDVIIFAIGFRLFYDPQVYRDRPIIGRHGFNMAKFYQNEPVSTYHGFAVPGMPNSFSMYGYYSWTGGSYHVGIEVAATHIGRVIAEACRTGAIDVEVRREPTNLWTKKSAHTPHSIFNTVNCSIVNTYYLDHHKRAAFYRPMLTRQARIQAKSFPLHDYQFFGPEER
ncbi:flavin-containing monooxygenase [Mycobacteroides abscessus]|uniref:flavin-containing monooxygenase n=1 Tax=Mycobacteroides abscessus TaxID=36809 RepID=UPI002104527F|nr:NAD(P)/FAD-dependent oxidoreductase [Mycobacteroides abscessus]